MESAAGGEVIRPGELEQENAPWLAVLERLNLPRLAVQEPSLQAASTQLVFGPGQRDVVDALHAVGDFPFKRPDEEFADEALLIADVVDGFLDVSRRDHSFNSMGASVMRASQERQRPEFSGR